jgi:hypothetical protein
VVLEELHQKPALPVVSCRGHPRRSLIHFVASQLSKFSFLKLLASSLKSLFTSSSILLFVVLVVTESFCGLIANHHLVLVGLVNLYSLSNLGKVVFVFLAFTSSEKMFTLKIWSILPT